MASRRKRRRSRLMNSVGCLKPTRNTHRRPATKIPQRTTWAGHQGAVALSLAGLLAAVLGLGGIAAASAGIAEVFFFIFVTLFLATVLSWPHLVCVRFPMS